MTFDLPKIYPITDRKISGLSHCEQVRRLIDGGAALIQLREKSGTPREFFSDAAQALRVARDAGVRIIINDRVDVAKALEADGVHLGQTDMPVKAARQILGPNAIIGYSTHNLSQVNSCLSLPISYLAFGPVFTTKSKARPDPVAGLELLPAVKDLCDGLPLVAIGGIHESNILSALRSGADATAVISAVLAEPTRIAQNLRQLMAVAANSG
jgi:thiamine-phosphate pyrophosphorylase